MWCNGRRIRLDGVTIYKPVIQRYHLNPGSIYDDEKYQGYFLRELALRYPDHYGVDWDDYHSKHPEVGMSEEELFDDEYFDWFSDHYDVDFLE